jgi:hypothetical protein
MLVTTSAPIHIASRYHIAAIPPPPRSPFLHKHQYQNQHEHESSKNGGNKNTRRSLNTSSDRHSNSNDGPGAGAGARSRGRGNGYNDNGRGSGQQAKPSSNRRIGGMVAGATLGIWSIDSGARPEDFHSAYGPPSPPQAAHHRLSSNNSSSSSYNSNRNNSSRRHHQRRHSDDEAAAPLSYSPPSLFTASAASSSRRIRLSTSPPTTSSHHYGTASNALNSPPLYAAGGASTSSSIASTTLSPDTSASPLRLLLDHLRQRGGERHVPLPRVPSSSSLQTNSNSNGSDSDGSSSSPSSSSSRIHHVPRAVRPHATTSPSWLSLGAPAWSQAATVPFTHTSDSPKSTTHNLHMAPAFVLTPSSSSATTSSSATSSTMTLSTLASTFVRSSPPLPSTSPPPSSSTPLLSSSSSSVMTAPAFVPLVTKDSNNGVDINDIKRTAKPLGRSHSGSVGNNNMTTNGNGRATGAAAAVSFDREADTKSTRHHNNGDAAGAGAAQLTAIEAERRARADPSMAAAFDAFRSKVHVDDDGKLSLSHYDLSMPNSWRALGYFLMASPNVRSLRLDGMDISEEEATMLGKGVLRQIKHIAFCGNNIGMLTLLLFFICQSSQSLTLIDITIGLTEGSMEIIVGILLLCEYLESAAFQRNSLDDEAMPHIARLISEHNTLSSLDLSLNGIADYGARHIALALSNLKYSFAKINLRYSSPSI